VVSSAPLALATGEAGGRGDLSWAGRGPVIAHLDLDAFFAAVEVLDDPDLQGRPVVVGGTGPRGVVASCSYEARRFGVSSAMPMVEARRRCPQAVLRPLRPGRYREVGRAFLALLQEASAVVEPVGLDEAYLVLRRAGSRGGDPLLAARQLRERVAEQLGLSSAVGVAAKKHLAKLASRAAKRLPPKERQGQEVVVVPPEAEAAFLAPLALGELPGVGPVTARRLAACGLHRVGDLRTVPRSALRRLLGPAAGDRLWALAQGELDEPVRPPAPRRSISKVLTFPEDLHHAPEIRRAVLALAVAVGEELASRGLLARSVVLGLRDANHHDHRRTLSNLSVTGPWSVLRPALALVDRLPLPGTVRAVSVGVHGLRGDPPVRQSPLPGLGEPGLGEPGLGEHHTWRVARGTPAATPEVSGQLDQIVAAVRARFGPRAALPASVLVGRGDQGEAVGPGSLVVVPSALREDWG
jgi:DNA polymerase-4